MLVILDDGLQSELLTIFDRWLNQLALSLTPPSGQLIFSQIDCRSWDQNNMQWLIEDTLLAGLEKLVKLKYGDLHAREHIDKEYPKWEPWPNLSSPETIFRETRPSKT